MGIFTLKTREFNDTTTASQEFTMDGIAVSVRFTISRNFSTKEGHAPLTFNSSMVFEFKLTNDYQFIYRLWRVAKQFIQFLFYRKNVFIPEAALSAHTGKDIHKGFATLHVLGESGNHELEVLEKGRYIKQSYLSGCEGKILSDIASEMIYLRHLPETYETGRYIDAARFVMITAAFEWEFRRAYPNGVKKAKATVEAEAVVEAAIQSLLVRSNGKQRKIYKFLSRLVKSDSLQSEIIQMGKDYDEVVGPFGRHLYSLNKEELKYFEMGARLSDQRNHYAHGDLDKDFIGLALLDLIFLERIIYAMQLKHYGISSENIMNAINELFHCGIQVESTGEYCSKTKHIQSPQDKEA